MVEKSGVGVAFDIGTTTIAGACVSLPEMRVLKEAACPNPQSRWGRDVLSRITAAVKDPELIDEMSGAVVIACNSLIREIVPIGAEIIEITAAGNPVMEHLLLKVSPEPLSRVPYRPAFLEAQRLKARDLRFEAGEDTDLYAFPLIGGFVGGDAVAVALSLRLKDEKRPTLAIDIGTNSEIMLSANGSLFATSAAAGPAFEGGEIKGGMIAASGAIRGVSIHGEDVSLDCIGGSTPKGICGSGLVSAVSELLKAGIIERSGRIRSRDEVSTNLSNRIREEKDGNSFVLYRGAKTEVALTQSDIRALQTAKSAIRAGINLLLKKAGIGAVDLGTIYIAGAFGSNLDPEGLQEIGILDKGWLENIKTAGDAALEGAVLALDSKGKEEAGSLAEEFKFVSLSGSAHFEREFIANLGF
ncbi:MAG: hypothetical protein A2X93_00735 [Deltaproteobacteria bacterium GWC2_56_8]|nr:MAG: hypothetical protein A2X99_02185 [Deltaproteobacteria bacterium GWB2_55_19]OGP32179.1 MAG: hypothetical protein A2X93_00735 [Deltaproteobacteria bacterium GWC2_56_8]